jgi:hypothetical protein
VNAPGCSELHLPAVKPAGKSRFTAFWGAIIKYESIIIIPDLKKKYKTNQKYVSYYHYNML